MTAVAGWMGGFVGTAVWVSAVTSPSIAGPLTVDMVSPITISDSPADIAKTPPRAIPLKVEEIGSSAVWNASNVRISQMPMPDGGEVTLVLRRMQNPIEATWLITTDSFGVEVESPVTAAPVLLLSGSVDGVPDSGVFLGIWQDKVQGWIETDGGLHMIATPPEGGPTIMYRVGAERGGIDVPPPGLFHEVPSQKQLARNPKEFVPETDYDRFLLMLQDPESPLRELLIGEGARRLPQMLDRSVMAIEPEFELGACCVMPGFCFQLTADLCADFCQEDDNVGNPNLVYCDRTWDGNAPLQFTTPTNLPPCWLGPGVPCDEQWVCYESITEDDFDPPDPGNPAIGNWTGACCVEVPEGSGNYQVEDLVACECALKGGDFIVPPALCIGEELAAPEMMAASNFVDAATILEIDPNICQEPRGACCIEQFVLCEDIADPDDPDFEMFKKVACVDVTEAVCGDAQILTDSFNGTGEAGYFTKDCFPCIFDPAGSGIWGSDFICPESMQKLPQGVGPSPQLVCQSPRITIDTDGWYLDRFDGDVQAAQAYAATLMASMNYILKRDALVEMQIGDLLIRGGEICAMGDNGTPDSSDDDVLECQPWDAVYYVGGACCFPSDGWCIDSESEIACSEWALQGYNAEWLGPGSSCWDESGTPCGNAGFVYEEDDRLWEIQDTLEAMTEYWKDPIAGTLTEEVRDRSNMILLLSGYPYGTPYFDNLPWPGATDWEDTWGVEVQDIAAGAFRTLCVEFEHPYVVASVKGTFPSPGTAFDRDNVNWDIIAVARAIGAAVGLSETSAFGYDDCVGPPCEGVGASVDCDHRFFYSELYELSSPYISNRVMPSTLMSFCHVCPGESSNIQLRYRSEMAARIYARFATMDCSWSDVGGLNPLEPGTPYAADDTFRTLPGGAQLLDVMANDITPGCLDQNIFEPFDPTTGDPWDPSTWDPSEDPWPIFPLDVTDLWVWQNDPFDPTTPFSDWWIRREEGTAGLPGLTILGGTIDIVDDPANPDGGKVVEYIPPAESCGIDLFQYRITTKPEEYVLPNGIPAPIPEPPGDAIATVRIIEQDCSASYTINCDPGIPGSCPESVAEPPVPPTPPDPAAADVVSVPDVAAAEIKSFSWSGLMLGWDTVGSTLAEDAFLRVWGASVAGGQADIFFDIYPFGDPGVTCGPIYPYVPGALPIAGPSQGQCIPMDRFFVPSNGTILVQCLEAVDDLPGRDAWWLAGEFCILSEATNAYGACCVDGMCIETSAYDCAAMGWNWEWLNGNLTDPDPHWGWTFDSNASGFFHGASTSCCDRDWCRRTAPCCYMSLLDKPACALLTCEECREIGGVMLTMSGRSNGTDYCDPTQPWDTDPYDIGPPQPLWDTECVYPVCNFENLDANPQDPIGDPLIPINPPDPSGTVGACCVATAAGDRFCTDLTRDDCELYASDLLIQSTSWSVVGRCDEVPCSSLGACCVDSGSGLACVADGLTEEECQSFWYLNPSNPPDQVVFRADELCGADSCAPTGVGACCLPDIDACCDGFSKEVCDLVYGIYLGDGVDCNACGVSGIASGVCALSNSGLPVCTTDLTQPICTATLGGTWYSDIDTCNEGIPDQGRGIISTNQPQPLVGSTNPLGACCYEYECVPQVTRFDCLLAGGHFLSDSENPYGTGANPGGCPPTQTPWLGRCCLPTIEFGLVCVKLSAIECANEGGSFSFTFDCASACGPGIVDLDVCAPGLCQVTLRGPSGIGGSGTVMEYITPDDTRCLSRNGRWVGYKSELGYTECPPTGPLVGGVPFSRRQGDLDGDDRVGASDLLLLFAKWGSSDPRADLDDSGRVGVDDLIRLLSRWN
ncbi:MAG: hypothetical protein GY894_05505 [Planctomycetes bacterium]|nr:hypothetical protein [Planctomycetota bacterium]